MQAKPGVIDRLNSILTIELTAINQYFLQAEMLRNWGYHRLYEKFRSFSLGEMQDAQQIVRQILFLEGVPNLQRLGAVRVGETPLEDLQIDLEAEMGAVETLREAIGHCASVSDFATRGMLEHMLRDEEEHVDWLETQLETIRQIGLQNYLTEQLG